MLRLCKATKALLSTHITDCTQILTNSITNICPVWQYDGIQHMEWIPGCLIKQNSSASQKAASIFLCGHAFESHPLRAMLKRQCSSLANWGTHFNPLPRPGWWGLLVKPALSAESWNHFDRQTTVFFSLTRSLNNNLWLFDISGYVKFTNMLPSMYLKCFRMKWSF